MEGQILFYILLVMMLLAKNAGMTEAKVITRPSQRYILEGHQGLVWCQNRSVDEKLFYSFVDNARWYRRLPNNMNLSINTSGPGVYYSGHTLIFSPTLRKIDQEQYFCCSSEGNSCSELTDVRITVSPSISAVHSSIVKEVGSVILTLQCNILNKGIPQAIIGWKKDGQKVNKYTFSNDTLTTLTLYNLTEEDSGLYTCIAIGPYSDHSGNVDLFVEKNSTLSQPITITADTTTLNCDEGSKEYLIENLFDYVQRVHNFTATVVVSSVKCANYKAVYEVEIISVSLNEVLPLLLKALNNTEGLHLGKITIKLCRTECKEMQSTTSSDYEEAKIHHTHVILIILLVLIGFTTIILVMLVIYTCYRWGQLKRVKSTLHKLNFGQNSNSDICLQDGQNKITVPVYSEIFTELKVLQNSQT